MRTNSGSVKLNISQLYLRNREPLGLKAIYLVVGGITKGDSAEELIALGNIEFLSDRWRPQRYGSLGAGSQAAGMGSKHEVLHEKAGIRYRILAKTLVGKYE